MTWRAALLSHLFLSVKSFMVVHWRLMATGRGRLHRPILAFATPPKSGQAFDRGGGSGTDQGDSAGHGTSHRAEWIKGLPSSWISSQDFTSGSRRARSAVMYSAIHITRKKRRARASRRAAMCAITGSSRHQRCQLNGMAGCTTPKRCHRHQTDMNGMAGSRGICQTLRAPKIGRAHV